MIGPQCCIEAGDLRGLFWPQGGAAQVASKQTRKKSTFCLFFYRTHVHMGSDHWVAMLVRGQKDLSENISEKMMKVLYIWSETKMELKTEHERMDGDSGSWEFGGESEINEIFENLNLSVQEELEENLKMMVDRYLLHDCFVDYRSLTHKCVPDWILRARGLKHKERDMKWVLILCSTKKSSMLWFSSYVKKRNFG